MKLNLKLNHSYHLPEFLTVIKSKLFLIELILTLKIYLFKT